MELKEKKEESKEETPKEELVWDGKEVKRALLIFLLCFEHPKISQQSQIDFPLIVQLSPGTLKPGSLDSGD